MSSVLRCPRAGGPGRPGLGQSSLPAAPVVPDATIVLGSACPGNGVPGVAAIVRVLRCYGHEHHRDGRRCHGCVRGGMPERRRWRGGSHERVCDPAGVGSALHGGVRPQPTTTARAPSTCRERSCSWDHVPCRGGAVVGRVTVRPTPRDDSDHPGAWSAPSGSCLSRVSGTSGASRSARSSRSSPGTWSSWTRSASSVAS